MSEAKISKGIPLRDRSEADIRAALADKEPEDVAQFVALHAYAKQHRLGVSALAAQTGISNTTLSQGFNGSYAGDYHETAERIRTFFWRLEQKEKYGGLRQFVQTDLAKNLFNVFEKTRVIRRIQIVQSPEQIGKTTIARAYTERNNAGRTVYVRMPGGSRCGFGDFVWNLAEVLGIAHTIKMREKRLRIRQILTACDLLLVDEAHILDSWTLPDQRYFWDYVRTDLHADGERGIILLYTNYDALAGLQTFRKAARYNVGQLLGRMRNEVITIDPAEDITESDVEALIARYYKPSREVVRKLHAAAQRDQLGHYGLLVDILNESWTLAKARKRQLTDEIVLSTAQEILDELASRRELYR